MKIYLLDRNNVLIQENIDPEIFAVMTPISSKPPLEIKKMVSSDLKNIYCELVSSDTIKFYIRSPKQIDFLCKQISKSFQRQENLRVGLSELLMNSLEHGNFNIDKDTKENMIAAGVYHNLIDNLVESNKNKFIELTYKMSGDKNIVITDQGEGFEFEKYLNPDNIDNSGYCGRGIFIAAVEIPKSNAQFDYYDQGNKLVISFK